MFNENLQQSLIALEKGLTEISSARSQVSNVSEKSERLVSALTGILQKLVIIDECLSIDKGDFKESIDKSFDNLSVDLLEVTTNAASRSNELNGELERIVTLFSEKVEGLKKSIEGFDKELLAAENRIKELDLKKELIEKFIQYHTESNNLYQQRVDELEKHLNTRFLRSMIIMVAGFVLLGLAMFLN